MATISGSCAYAHCTASHYLLHCGLTSADGLSHDTCRAFSSGTLRFASEPGTLESHNLSLRQTDTLVFVGVVTFDNAGNLGKMSNIVTVYREGPRTTTTTTTTTTSELSDYPNTAYISTRNPSPILSYKQCFNKF